MKILLILTLSFCSFFSFSQRKKFPLIDSIYSNWVQNNNTGPGKCDLFLYTDSIDNHTIERVTDLFLEDSVFFNHPSSKQVTHLQCLNFSAKERDFIIKKLRKINSQPLRSGLFVNSRVIPFNQIDSIQKSVNDKQLDPLIRLCYTVHLFAEPI